MEAVQGCTKTLSFHAPVACEACGMLSVMRKERLAYYKCLKSICYFFKYVAYFLQMELESLLELDLKRAEVVEVLEW